MAVKTITIDIEAYEKLASEKKANESFSQAIKRILNSRKMTADKLLKSLDKLALSEDALTHVERIVQNHEQSFPEAPRPNQE